MESPSIFSPFSHSLNSLTVGYTRASSSSSSTTQIHPLGLTPLHHAVLEKSFDKVEACFKDPKMNANEWVNAQDNEGKTPLFWAVEDGSFAIVQLLLECNPDLEIKNNKGTTALDVAVARNDVPLVQVLLRAGAKSDAVLLEAVTKFNCEAYTTLTSAGVDPQMLLKAAASNPNYSNIRDQLILLGVHDTINILESAGVNVRDLLMEAASDESRKALRDRLIALDADDHLLFFKAIQESQWDKIKEYVAAGGGARILNIAAKNGDIATIEALVGCGMNLDIEQSGNRALVTAAGAKQYETVCRMLQMGANPSAPNGAGQTALHQAASHGDYNMTLSLLGYGADVNARDYQGTTPLIRALYARHADIVQLLRLKGASAKWTTVNPLMHVETALVYANQLGLLDVAEEMKTR